MFTKAIVLYFLTYHSDKPEYLADIISDINSGWVKPQDVLNDIRDDVGDKELTELIYKAGRID